MGTARSGSTILEILLAKGSGVFGAGELTSLIQDGFIENKQCSCGASCADCDIWGKVSEHLKLDKQELEEWAVLQKKMDWHDGLIKQLFSVMPKKDIFRYQELNFRLLMAIQEVTGCEVVLDSSKYAGRGLALLRVLKADVKVICLTRSPAGLMQSFQKPNKDEQHPKSPMASLMYYFISLMLLRIVSYILGKQVFHLSYESLIENPEGVVASIESWSGIGLSETREKLNTNEKFEVGHLITANRLRKQGSIRFDPRQSKPPEFNLSSKVAIALMKIWKWILRFE